MAISMACGASFGQSLPDLSGNYYFTSDRGTQISSRIYNQESFTLKSDDGTHHIQVVRVTDKIRVIDVITYFAQVLVTEVESKKSKKMEMVLVENETLNRIRLELDSGEEWIRLVPSPSGTSPGRR